MKYAAGFLEKPTRPSACSMTKGISPSMNLRSFRPAYFFKRLEQMRFEKSHPDAPWLAESAILLLDSYLKPTDVGFEWGSGRSTLWLTQRVAHLHSIEDNSLWHSTVKKQLKAAQLTRKVTYQLIPCEW